MFFEKYIHSGKAYCFKNVRRPESEEDCIEIGEEEQYEALRPQFEAFRSMILNETIEGSVV
jgi:hypothetical protein